MGPNYYEGDLDNEFSYMYYTNESQTNDYSYSSDQIIVVRDNDWDLVTCVYRLTNGLIVEAEWNDKNQRNGVKYIYDNNKRLKEVREIRYSGEGEDQYSDYMFTWHNNNIVKIEENFDDYGDIYIESECTFAYSEKKASNSIESILPIFFMSEIFNSYRMGLDPLLIAQGYFGNSYPTNLVSSYHDDYMATCSLTYEFYDNKSIKTIKARSTGDGMSPDEVELTFVWD
ncbi:MAG: hypothetical protein NC343_01500 [Muribaculum sp.]|nr:hypothetical protein [Muribaculaceae bacterium]MCM1080411.1 hypothetical protein [Muribaculum sp.]